VNIRGFPVRWSINAPCGTTISACQTVSPLFTALRSSTSATLGHLSSRGFGVSRVPDGECFVDGERFFDGDLDFDCFLDLERFLDAERVPDLLFDTERFLDADRDRDFRLLEAERFLDAERDRDFRPFDADRFLWERVRDLRPLEGRLDRVRDLLRFDTERVLGGGFGALHPNGPFPPHSVLAGRFLKPHLQVQRSSGFVLLTGARP